MKGVVQTIFSPPEGNCFQACVASILEMELEAVPNFVHLYGDRWHDAFSKWLATENMYPMMTEEDRDIPIIGYSILSAALATGGRHCLVCKDGEVVWNPATGDGDGVPWATRHGDYHIHFLVLNPAKLLHHGPILPGPVFL